MTQQHTPKEAGKRLYVYFLFLCSQVSGCFFFFYGATSKRSDPFEGKTTPGGSRESTFVNLCLNLCHSEERNRVTMEKGGGNGAQGAFTVCSVRRNRSKGRC